MNNMDSKDYLKEKRTKTIKVLIPFNLHSKLICHKFYYTRLLLTFLTLSIAAIVTGIRTTKMVNAPSTAR